MKKLLSAVCILAMTAMTLAGCGSSSTQETKAATTEAAVSEAASEEIGFLHILTFQQMLRQNRHRHVI